MRSTSGPGLSFNHGKQWRGFATRYDELGIVYRGAAVLNATIRWLLQLRDTPKCQDAKATSCPTARGHLTHQLPSRVRDG